MAKNKEQRKPEPGQIWTVFNGALGFYLIEKVDKKTWLAIYVEPLSDRKFIEIKSEIKMLSLNIKNKKTHVREKNLIDLFKLQENAEFISNIDKKE